ncbi:MAG: EAL domain-containing protein [Ruminococcus sp.]|nr:EAL domain-containing protein [Ruminococcus sp.]
MASTSLNKKDEVKKVPCGRYVVDFSQDGKIVSFNDGFLSMTGYTPEQLENGDITFFSLVPPEDYDAYMEQLTQIAVVGGGTLEHRLLCSDGSKIDIICIGQQMKSDESDTLAEITICSISDKAKLKRENLESKREIETLIDIVPGEIAVYKIENGEPKLLKASEQYYNVMGMSKDGSCELKHVLSENDYKKLTSDMIRCLENGSSFDRDIRIHIDEKHHWIHFIGRLFENDSYGGAAVYCTASDITDAKHNERKLEKQNLCFKMVSENTEEMFFDYDADRDIFSITTDRYRLNGGKSACKNYLEGKPFEDYIHPDDLNVYMMTWQTALESPINGTLDYRTKEFDNDYKWYRLIYTSVADEGDNVSSVYGMVYCIDHVKVMKSKIADDRKEIERLSKTDPVTGLYNRNAFKKAAAEALKEMYTDDECFAIGYSDINDFSYVNENFGYEAGDKMLVDFADIIRACGIGVVGCRIYSDYFVSLYHAKDRETLIREIGKRNDRFTSIQKEKYPLSNIQISCGLYFLRSADDDITVAIDNANLARRSVKGSSDIPSGVYTDRMRARRSHDQTIASEVQSAINNGQIELFLQPKFDLDTREIIGAEALSRWRNPDGSYKMPYEFIDVLENVGYITQVDMCIYEQVLKCLSKWQNEGKKLLPISVNFSRKHNNNPKFVEKIVELANEYGVDKSLIEIEVTESCFTQDVKNLFANMRKLREQGFKVDIDDFGTGYSSLSVLIDAPVDIVKVDKVFIDNIDTNERSRDYINQICGLINSTRKQIIFEGVETEEQAQILLESGYTMAQGWLFDKAIPVPEFDSKYL